MIPDIDFNNNISNMIFRNLRITTISKCKIIIITKMEKLIIDTQHLMIEFTLLFYPLIYKTNIN